MNAACERGEQTRREPLGRVRQRRMRRLRRAHPSLLDVAGALEALREVSVGSTLGPDALRATVTRHTGRTRG
jgi:hypothetical protein